MRCVDSLCCAKRRSKLATGDLSSLDRDPPEVPRSAFSAPLPPPQNKLEVAGVADDEVILAHFVKAVAGVKALCAKVF